MIKNPAMTKNPAPAVKAPVPSQAEEAPSMHAELRETRQGWVLTLRTDADTARALRSAGLDTLSAKDVSVAVTPNLVPGEPFDLSAVRVVTDDAVTNDAVTKDAPAAKPGAISGPGTTQPPSATANSGEA